MPKLLIVDDHPLYREGVVHALSGHPLHAVVVGAANAGDALFALSADPAIDLVLADLKLATENGLEVLRLVGSQHPGVARVLVSADDSPEVRRAAQAAGLQGFLPKSLSIGEMLAAIARVLDGDVAWPPSSAREEPPSAAVSLTLRQREVLSLLAAGHSNAEMAVVLGIAERTVKAHLGLLFDTLGVDSRTRALARARQLGLTR